MHKDGLLLLTVPSGPMAYYDHHIGHVQHFSQKEIAEKLAPHFYNISVTGLGFPFYNVYRILRQLRGKKLVTDAVRKNSGNASYLLLLTSAILRFLLQHCSMKNSPYAWQLFVTARKR